MDSLAYDLLIDNKVKRIVKILTILLEDSNPIPIGLLAQKLNITQRTLQLDITNIIATIPNNVQLITYNSLPSIKKTQNNDLGITNYLNDILLGNPLFIIIESIFNGEIYDSSHFSEHLYISESTVKNYLFILKKVLKSYNLTLSYSPIDILGNEIEIRYFYFQYFRYARSSEAPILRDDQYITMLNIIKSTINNHGIILNFDYYRLASWLTIITKRIKQNKHVHLSETIHSKYAKKDSYLKFKLAIYTHYVSKEITLSESEIMYAYLTRLDAVIYEEHKSFFTDDFFDQLKKFEPLTVDFLKKSNRNLSINLTLSQTLQAYLVNISMLTELSTLYQKVPEKLKQLVENKHSKILTIWNELLKNQTNFFYTYELSVNLTLISETHLHTKKRLLFALTGESASINYYKEMALKYVPYDMEVFFVFNAPLDNKLLEKMEIDLCVYNITPQEKLTYSNLFKLSNIPLGSEWDKLLILLHNV